MVGSEIEVNRHNLDAGSRIDSKYVPNKVNVTERRSIVQLTEVSLKYKTKNSQ